MMKECYYSSGLPQAPVHCTAVSHYKEQVSQVRIARIRVEGGEGETPFSNTNEGDGFLF